MRSVASLSALLLAGVTSALPCVSVTADSSIRVGRTFEVRVLDGDRPVGGLTIKAKPADGAALTSTTDAKGLATFSAVAPGSYFVTTDYADYVSLDISPTEPAGKRVTLHWPVMPSVKARSASGVMKWTNVGDPEEQPALHVELREALSSRVVAQGTTDKAGFFNLGGFADGLYFLRLSEAGITVGAIPLRVDPSAQGDRLNLSLTPSDCGLGYLDLNSCARPDLTVRRIVGKVVDTSGAVIPRAKIVVSDSTGKAVDNLTSDENGMFASRISNSGEYGAVVRAPSFVELDAHLRLASEAPDSQIAFTLGFGLFQGSCGSARIK